MSTATRARLLLSPRILPNRSELVDLVAMLGLGAVALWGLRLTYAGWWFLAVGIAGLLLGMAISHLADRLRQPVVMLALLVVAAFFLLGGPVVLSLGGGSAVPLPGTLEELADGLVHGWKDLLTTLPPVSATGPLLLLPYILGLVSGAVGIAVARRTPRAFWPAAAPVALLVAVILLGVDRPVSTLQGVIFGVGLVVWMVLRAERSISSQHGRGGLARAATGLVLLGVAGAVAFPITANVLHRPDARVVLRTHVTPPFDIGQYPSPLASFRRFTKQQHPTLSNLHNTELFNVKGLPDGSLIRIGVLDSYDGTVWGASNANASGPTPDTFQRVGATIATTVPGREVRATVTMESDALSVWMPTVGALTAVDFEGKDAAADTDSFRYNLATWAGVVPARLGKGDRYTFTARLPDTTLRAGESMASGSADVQVDAAFIETNALAWAGDGTSLKRVLNVAKHLRTQGRYSDGDGADSQLYHPGHHSARLDEFLNSPQIVGNDEQYAAAMALAANKLGVPARVVFGAKLKDGQVKGSDVRAWVELQRSDGMWLTLPRESFVNPLAPPLKTPPQDKNEYKGVVVPPPAPVPPPSSLGDPTDNDIKARAKVGDNGFGLPVWMIGILKWLGIPLLVVLAWAALVLGAKELRRRRRRTASRVSTRFVGGWAEVLDRAAELRIPVRRDATRREQARELALPAALHLAREADASVFGPGEPSEDQAQQFWERVDEVRAALAGERTRLQRLRLALSLRSFARPVDVPVKRLNVLAGLPGLVRGLRVRRAD